jgi:hypothetical protein
MKKLTYNDITIVCILSSVENVFVPNYVHIRTRNDSHTERRQYKHTTVLRDRLISTFDFPLFGRQDACLDGVEIQRRNGQLN